MQMMMASGGSVGATGQNVGHGGRMALIPKLGRETFSGSTWIRARDAFRLAASKW